MSEILKGIKNLLGIPEETTVFDSQLVMYINMALKTLDEIGFMPNSGPFQITLSSGELNDYIPEDDTIHDTVMIYIHAKVRLLFDPPSSAYVLKALEDFIDEQEFRLQTYKPQ